MFLREFYQEAVNKKKGVVFSICRLLLAGLSFLYFVAISIRQLFYRMKILRRIKIPAIVISVGNITVGGTGKTPTVEFLAKYLSKAGFSVSILSRGYGKTIRFSKIAQEFSDDEDIISDSESQSGITRFTGRDRIALAKKSVASIHPDVFVLDDGFQYIKMERDFDILVIDSCNPFSNGHLLPRGFLREPLSQIKRADVILLTRTNQVDKEKLDDIRKKIFSYAPKKIIIESIHEAVSVREITGGMFFGLDFLNHKSLFAFCGIGNPLAFQKTLQSLNANVVRFRAFPDHYNYTALDLRQMIVEAQEFVADYLITTEKDARRLESILGEEYVALPLLVLRVELRITKGWELLEERLKSCLSLIPTRQKTSQNLRA